MNDSLVSVVMPMYNSERFILDSVKSILSQTHRELELLIVNDCSTDGSLKNIGSISDERIKIFSNGSFLKRSIANITAIRVFPVPVGRTTKQLFFIQVSKMFF